MSIKLFVYGSLKQGYWNHTRLKNATFLGQVTTSPRFDIVSLGSFPGLYKNGAYKIQGELYEVTPQQLQSCDHLEGHPTFYRREEILLDDGTTCFSYIYQGKYQPNTHTSSDIRCYGDTLEWRPHK